MQVCAPHYGTIAYMVSVTWQSQHGPLRTSPLVKSSFRHTFFFIFILFLFLVYMFLSTLHRCCTSFPAPMQSGACILLNYASRTCAADQSWHRPAARRKSVVKLCGSARNEDRCVGQPKTGRPSALPGHTSSADAIHSQRKATSSPTRTAKSPSVSGSGKLFRW